MHGHGLVPPQTPVTGAVTEVHLHARGAFGGVAHEQARVEDEFGFRAAVGVAAQRCGQKRALRLQRAGIQHEAVVFHAHGAGLLRGLADALVAHVHQRDAQPETSVVPERVRPRPRGNLQRGTREFEHRLAQRGRICRRCGGRPIETVDVRERQGEVVENTAGHLCAIDLRVGGKDGKRNGECAQQRNQTRRPGMVSHGSVSWWTR